MNYSRALHDLKLRRGEIPYPEDKKGICKLCKQYIYPDAGYCIECKESIKRLRSKITNIQKSQKDYSKLIPKKITAKRNGKTFQTTVYVKPAESKPATKPQIPTIKLESLPEHLKIEKLPTNKFRSLLLIKFRDKHFQNRHTKADILVSKSGINHSLSNKYSPDSINITRASLLQLDKLLKNAIKIKTESDRHSDKNVLQVDTYQIKIKTGNPYHGYQYYNVNLLVKKRKDTGETFYDHLVINEDNKSISKSLLKNGWEQKSGATPAAIITGKEYIKERSSFPNSQRHSTKVPQLSGNASEFPQTFGIDESYHNNNHKAIEKSHKKNPLPDLTTITNLPDLTASGLPDLTITDLLDYPSEPNPEQCKERYSYDESLEDVCECGELTLCPMRPKWQPYRLKKNTRQILKSYELKSGERWITIHPNGEDKKGICKLCKQYIYPYAGYCIECKESIKRLRSKIINIQKSQKDYSKLIPKKITAKRNGKTFQTTVYVKPAESKPATKPQLPTIKLQELPEHLKVENLDRDGFLQELKQIHANTWVTWKDGKTKFKILPVGLKHSNSNSYPKERINLTRAALYQLDKLLSNAGYDDELNPESETNVTNVYRYLIKAALQNTKAEEFHVIIKRREGIEKDKLTDTLYDVRNIEKASKAGLMEGATRTSENMTSLHQPQKKLYHDNSKKSIEKSHKKNPLPDLTTITNLPDLTASGLPDLTQPASLPDLTITDLLDYPSEPNPEQCKERYSYDESLEDACECGELTLCPMRPKWQPYRLKKNTRQILKSYELKSGERWITIHPNGEDNKGTCKVCKQYIYPDAGYCIECKESIKRLRSNIINIQKSHKDYSKLIPKKITAKRNGKTFQTTVYVKPAESKPATKPQLPTIKLQELPEHLKVENLDRDGFLQELKQIHANTWVTWKDGKTKFKILPVGLKHSNSNSYPKERINLTRAALYQLDKLLSNAGYDDELNPESETNVTNVYRYLIKAALQNTKAEEFQVIIKRRKGIEKDKLTDTLYDIRNIEKASEAGVSEVETQINGNMASLSPRLKKYHSNNHKAIEKSHKKNPLPDLTTITNLPDIG